MTTQFEHLLKMLAVAGVKFVLVGGGAAIAHGSARLTLDLDIVYARDRENMQRLVEMFRPLNPYLRGAPPGLPFRWDVETLARGLNFTLTTTLGDVDLLGEVTGGGRYEDLLSRTIELEAFGVTCRSVTLRTLIALKRAAGRPRDFDAIAELEVLLEEQQHGQAE